MILALVLLAQVLIGPVYYVLPYPPVDGQMMLVTDTGRYPIDLGQGCDGIEAYVNVEWMPGSGNVGAIRPLGSDMVCNVHMNAPVDPTPCFQTDDVCDVANESD